MILSIRLDNFLVFGNEVELSLKANMHIKKFGTSVYSKNNFNILKSACVYGPNNSGKTCLVRGINSIKNVLLGNAADVTANIFSGRSDCRFGISFTDGDSAFSYDFRYDSATDGKTNTKKGFIYECLKELSRDKYGNESERVIFVRDVENNVYKFYENPSLDTVLSVVSSDNILIYTVNTNKCAEMEKYKKILRNLASKIEIFDMGAFPINKTIDVLKNNSNTASDVIELIKSADLEIDDFGYDRSMNLPQIDSGMSGTVRGRLPDPNVLLNDMLRLTSVHKGRPVRSAAFDSKGTMNIIAAASYIVESLKEGKVLVIDELDSSLHFKITRAVIALFNNALNSNAQLIFTAHDVTLLDCKTLFRKDQIWFASKDRDREYLYSLADFTTKETGIRSEDDIAGIYKKGVLGAIPDPDFIDVLINMKA